MPKGNIIYLASSSPRRIELLERAGIPFAKVMKEEFAEENTFDLSPAEYATWLALCKASKALDIENGFVLGADTIVVQRGDIMEKPDDIKHAKEHLSRLSGKWHTVITALALVRYPEGMAELEDSPPEKIIGKLSANRMTAFEATRVLFSNLTEEEIDAYVSSREPSDKAGAYGIQEKGALLVERVEGCFYNVVGLPLFRLMKVLGEFGLDRLSFLK
ncbi:MAG: Maf family protein [Candidatus Zixiibacteriota bacterium]